VGTYNVVLTVTDSASHTSTSSVTEVAYSSSPLIAIAYETPTSASVGTAVTFDGAASAGVPSYNYFWNFGDGTSSTSQDPSHPFKAAGTYKVLLTVTDSSGNSATSSVSEVVYSPLTATAYETPTSASVGTAVTFDGAASAGVPSYNYFWNFGDGTSSTSQDPSHSFSSAGTYNVVLLVTDSSGHSATSSVTEVVYNPLRATATQTAGVILAGTSATFGGAASGGPPTSGYGYMWNFGDGTSSSSQSPTHTYAQAGVYRVTLTVTDAGQSATSSVNEIVLPNQLAPASCCPTGALNNVFSVPSNAFSASPMNMTGQPVEYNNGVAVIAAIDLESDAFGEDWGQARTWSNQAANAVDSDNGNGWTDGTQPHLFLAGNELLLVTNSITEYDFIGQGTPNSNGIYPTYAPTFNDTSTITYNSSANEFELPDGTGGSLTFFGFGSSYPAAQQGGLAAQSNANGDLIQVVSSNAAGLPTELEQSATVNGTFYADAYFYTYLGSSDPNAGLLSTVTLEQKTGSGTWQPVQSVAYEYYTSSSANGNLGDLERAIIEDPSGNALQEYYYRYYTSTVFTSGVQTGYQGGLEYVVDPQQYAELQSSAGGTDADVDAASNATVSSYADNYFQYNSNLQVSEEIAAGVGCSLCSAGQGTYTFSYTSSTNAAGFNSWAEKTVVTLPNDTVDTVYSNAYAEVMLSAELPSGASTPTITYYNYNDNGQVVLMADPSAMTGYNDSYADLVNFSPEGSTYISSASGLVTTYSYYSSTTADATEAGGVANYMETTFISQGQLGTAIPQETYTYFYQSAGGAVDTPVATDTVYSNSDGSGAETTSYSYTWFAGTAQEESVTTTLPVITTAQNGSGTANTTTTVYNQFGQACWTMDPNGYISYSQYDPLTGGVVEQIQDVNTSNTSDFYNLPSGWTTPAGGGLNLVTSNQVDNQGRVTEQTNPNGTVDYFVYDDVDNEMREYDGWNSSTDTATGPTKVTIDDWANGYTETLTMTAAPSVSDGAPTGTEAITDIQSLSRSYINDAGQVVEEDDYFNLGGLTYSSGAMGTSGVNYYATLYAYAAGGEQDRVIDPQGTITRMAYNGLGQEVSEWVGTNDTPTSGYWSPSNPAGMVEVESFQYDNGGVSDGNLTETIQYPGNGAPDRVTQYWYNWEDEKVAEKDGVSSDESDGVNRPLTVYTYDNLGEVTETQVYSGDGVTPTISDGELSLPSGIASDLQAQTKASYNNQGQVYQTQVYSVDPTTGDVSSTALTTNYYYDADGNPIAKADPGGLWAKEAYNGAGQVVMEYETDGGGGTSYVDASTVSGDVVLTQTQYIYDGDGNVVEAISSDRFNTDSATATGALGTPTSGVKARVYYSGNYYDLADRLIASVEVGTNGGSAWTMPDSPPSRSDDALVTTYSYAADAVQWVTLTGDPTGGTFTLTFGGDTTSSIAYNASASTVQSDLEALGSIGSGNVEVTLVPGGGWQVHFTGSLAGAYQGQIAPTSSLTGGTSPGVSVNAISLGGDNGKVVDTIDPDGIDDRDYYNSLGQVVQEVQDYTNGVVTAGSNKTTDYTLNSAGMTSLTADMGNGTGETTEWIYGVSTATGSAIDSNDVAAVTEEPDPSTGQPDSSLAATITVDTLGETLTSTDPNGTTHTYIYDVLGQEIADQVTTLGSGVDGSIMEIGTSYTTLGNPYFITTYSGTSPPYGIVNQLEYVYNGLDQLTQEYQSVSGMVTDDTPSIQYIYTDLADGNNSRLTEEIYPDGYTVDYNYATGIDSDISRLTSVSDDTGTLESYRYLGLDTVVEMDHPEDGIDLTYISQTGGTGSAGDQYTGLDQFGRAIEQNWYDPSTGSSVVDLKYGYDNDENVQYEDNVLQPSQSELFTYDGLGQVTSYEQGTLNSTDTAISGTPSIDETWTYDPLGNHTSDSTTTSSGTTTVTSEFNFDNQITSISGGTNPAYDSDGNMTTDQNGLQYAYNAWGQLVTVKNSSGTTLESYTYDGLGNRMTNTVGSTTTNLFNSASGQVLEEQANATGDYTQRYVWSPNYINEMILRDTDTSGTGLSATGSSYTRLFALQDVNYSTVALVNMSGTVIERYSYDPFGNVTVMTASYGSLSGSLYDWIYFFQGGRADTITGDFNFGVRNENPSLGTWMSTDPTGFWGEDVNLYRAFGNNGIIHVDPNGKLFWIPIIIVGAVLITCCAGCSSPPPPPITRQRVTTQSGTIVGRVATGSHPGGATFTPVTVPGTTVSGTGPCVHAAAQLVTWLRQQQANGSNVRYRVRTFTVNPALLPPVDGHAPWASFHVVVEVTTTDADGNPVVTLYDGGTPARPWANLGDANGVIAPGALQAVIDCGALTETTP
jgi:RHS repeat-associated protein